MTKVSVIIPAFNLSYHIQECLKSLEKQTFKDFEVLIINDGSTDDTLEIVNNYILNSDLNIVLVSQKNSGVSSARNKGIELSSGEFICFVDGDDMLHPEYIHMLFNQIINEDTKNLALCTFKVIEENIKYGKIKEHDVLTHEFKMIEKNEVMKKYLLNQLKISIWSLLIPKRVIEDYKIYFSEDSKYSEDMEFVWKLLVHVENIYYIDEKLYYYKIRNDSAMSKIGSSRADGYKLFVRLEDYLKNENSEFYPFFKKYAKSKWVWSTVWQTSVVATSFNNFEELISIYNPKEHMKNLKTIPDKKISLSARVFLVSPFLYYTIVKKIGTRKFSTRRLVSEPDEEK